MDTSEVNGGQQGDGMKCWKKMLSPFVEPSSKTNMFGQIKERRVIFCLDTSGSMYGCLDMVKHQLIDALEMHAQRQSNDDAFNIIEFSTSVVQWAEEMISWTPETVQIAAKWIHELTAKTGTNTRDALLTAFRDESCEAVYLITDTIPDQRTDDVVDVVLQVSGLRPIHCFYIQHSSLDQAAESFLQELAMETYGSFHIVNISPAGVIESITPIYRAEATAEKLVRTTSGNIFPSAHKLCSVGTSLDGPPSTVLPVSPYGLPVVPPWPYCLYPWPYRYYHGILTPYDMASMRWRPAKAWLKHTQDFVDHMKVVPGAGAMLVGARVLARRHADGFFYMGTVKSQIVDSQFLVEFGPCKHGKFTDTEYQETYVYDIVSFADALRHPVLLDDKVLAPWEPEGERYAPGVVISGHEKRMADGGDSDQQLVVTFHDGKTVSVPRDKAMWIPNDLYERIVFEIRLPKNVRKEFATRDLYPFYNAFGYPASGSLAFPAQFEMHQPMSVGWSGSGCQGYPWMAHAGFGSLQRSNPELNTATKSPDEIIPGTNLTKTQLNNKVLSQIMQNKMSGTDDRLLNKRAIAADGSLKKSVSFADLKDEVLKHDGAESADNKDSGHGSQLDLTFSDTELDLYDEENRKTSRDVGVGTRTSRCYSAGSKSRSDSPQRRSWKYWKNQPSPSLIEPMHYGPYREGPYRDCLDYPSVLLRDAKKDSYNTVEWTSPISHVVDTYASYKHRPSVKDCLIMPRPPDFKPPKQGPGVDLSEAVGLHQRSAEQMANARMDFKQRQVLAREIGWQRRVADEEHARQMAFDCRRRQVEQHLHQEHIRAENHLNEAQRRMAARQQIHEQLNRKFQENAENTNGRETQRIQALCLNKINRNLQKAQHEAEQHQIHAQRQAIRQMKNDARIHADIARISEQEMQSAAEYRQKVHRQAATTEHFRRLENDAQKRKELSTQVADQAKAIHRSRIFF